MTIDPKSEKPVNIPGDPLPFRVQGQSWQYLGCHCPALQHSLWIYEHTCPPGWKEEGGEDACPLLIPPMAGDSSLVTWHTIPVGARRQATHCSKHLHEIPMPYAWSPLPRSSYCWRCLPLPLLSNLGNEWEVRNAYNLDTYLTFWHIVWLYMAISYHILSHVQEILALIQSHILFTTTHGNSPPPSHLTMLTCCSGAGDGGSRVEKHISLTSLDVSLP